MIDPKKLKVIFIDLDGTLVDSVPMLYGVYRAFLQTHGHEGTRQEFDELVGPALPEIMATLQRRYRLRGGVMELVEAYQQILYAHYVESLALFSGAKQFLDMAALMGLRMFLVTSASGHLAQAFLNAQGLEVYFDGIIGGDEVVRSKPDPAIYQRALFQAEVSPGEALVIEDSPKGVAAAVGAGIATLQLIHKKTPIAGIGEAKVSQVADWHEINELFKVWYEQV